MMWAPGMVESPNGWETTVDDEDPQWRWGAQWVEKPQWTKRSNPVEEATEMMVDGSPVVHDGECSIYGVESQRGDGGPSG